MAIRLINKGWKTVQKVLDKKRYQAILSKEMRRSLVMSANILLEEYRDAIDRRRIRPWNKPLTIAIKGKNHPLLDSGGLRDSIKITPIGDHAVSVGIPRSSQYYNIARIVSDGANIEVTDKMRLMFLLLYRVSEGLTPASVLRGRAAELWEKSPGEWYPLDPNKRLIRIPPRPFIKRTFERPSVKKRVRRQMEIAYKQALMKHIRQSRSSG